MKDATEIILNTRGNHHRDGRHWVSCQQVCLRELAPAEVTLVESTEEAAEAARKSALRGYRKIVSAGDGDTAHGVVNGLMSLAENHRRQIKIGFLCFSRPHHWSRTLGLPRDLSRQLEILSAGHTLPFDVGRVDCRDMAGERVSHHFLNGVWFGVLGGVREAWNNPESNLLNGLPRITERLRNAVSPAASRMRLESQGLVLHDGPCSQVMVMGGRYYPSFGAVAPQADPADGLLEVSWLESPTLWDLGLKFSRMWLSRLRGNRQALFDWRSVDHLRAVSLGEPVFIEADGLPVGRLPANITVAPRALEVMVAPVAARLIKPKFAKLEKVKGGRLAGNLKSAAGR